MRNKYRGTVFIMSRRKQKRSRDLLGEFVKTRSLFHCLFCVGAWASHTGLHLTLLLSLAFLLISLVLNFCFFSFHLRCCIWCARLYRQILCDDRKCRRWRRLTNQPAQISLRRDICSETISQVVICGIIASPTHKCMGVCMRYASVCVCGIRWSQECPPNCLTGL